MITVAAFNIIHYRIIAAPLWSSPSFFELIMGDHRPPKQQTIPDRRDAKGAYWEWCFDPEVWAKWR